MKEPTRITIGITDHTGKSPEKPITAALVDMGEEGNTMRWRDIGESFVLESAHLDKWVEVSCVKKP